MEIRDIPVPLKSFRASMVLSIATCGRRQGPALKTCTFFMNNKIFKLLSVWAVNIIISNH
jgi:hypothetical protein